MSKVKAKIIVIEPGETVGMKLTAAQRSLVAAEVPSLDDKFKQALKETPVKDALCFSLQDWDTLSETISEAAKNATEEKVEAKLTDIVVRIDQLLSVYSDVSPEQMMTEAGAAAAQIDSQRIASYGEWADMWDAAAKESGIGDERAIPLTLESAPLEILEAGLLKGIAPAKKLLNGRTLCTATEVSAIIRSLIAALKERPPVEKMAILMLIDQVMGQLENAVAEMASGGKRRSAKSALVANSTKAAKGPANAKADVKVSGKPIYQIKITLKLVEPAVWRRILMQDCSLDDLHGLIQASMGWSNSHLHHFRIGKAYYSNSALTDDPWGGADDDENDSTKTNLSDVVPEGGKKFRFEYEYDFGDCWNHEVLIEKRLPEDKTINYPACIDGGGRCPLEDIGGPYGYMDFLEAMKSPKHERREDFADILDNMKRFDPTEFEVDEANKAMHWKKGRKR